MKMVEDMHGVRAVFKYGGDESGREIGGDILDVELLSSDPFPKYCCPLNFKTTRFLYPQRPSIGVADSFFEK